MAFDNIGNSMKSSSIFSDSINLKSIFWGTTVFDDRLANEWKPLFTRKWTTRTGFHQFIKMNDSQFVSFLLQYISKWLQKNSTLKMSDKLKLPWQQRVFFVLQLQFLSKNVFSLVGNEDRKQTSFFSLYSNLQNVLNGERL